MSWTLEQVHVSVDVRLGEYGADEASASVVRHPGVRLIVPLTQLLMDPEGAREIARKLILAADIAATMEKP